MARYVPTTIANILAGLSTLNANLVDIQTSFGRMLSRYGTDGTNNMESDLDMNSFKIINLPAPTTSTEPLRYGDVTTLITPLVESAETAADAAAASATAAASSASSASSSATSAANSANEAAETLVSVINYASLIGANPYDVNVLSFGADNTGTNSSVAAFNAAFEHIKTLDEADESWVNMKAKLTIPPGKYLIDDTINATGCRSRAFVIEASGAMLYATCTGKAVIDAIRTRYWRWQNGLIVGDATNMPSYGIQHGRSFDEGVADNMDFVNLTMNGYFSKRAIINIAAERTTYERCKIANFHNDATVLGKCLTVANRSYEVAIGTVDPETGEVASVAPFEIVTSATGGVCTGFTTFSTVHVRGGFYATAEGAGTPIFVCGGYADGQGIWNVELDQVGWNTGGDGSLGRQPSIIVRGYTHNLQVSGRGETQDSISNVVTFNTTDGAPIARGFRFMQHYLASATGAIGVTSAANPLKIEGAHIVARRSQSRNYPETDPTAYGSLFSTAGTINVTGVIDVSDDQFLNEFSGLDTFSGTIYSGALKATMNDLHRPAAGSYTMYFSDGVEYKQETGSFTPTLSFATPGTSSFAYTSQLGSYHIVGDRCYFHLTIAGTPTIGTGTGAIRIGGLPYDIDPTTPALTSMNVETSNGNFNWGAGHTQLVAYGVANSNYIQIRGIGSATTAATLTETALTSGAATTIEINGSYKLSWD